MGSASRPDLCRGCRVTGIPTALERRTIHHTRSPLLHFLRHAVGHLCYDARVHEHIGRAPCREETGWTLSQWWIRSLRSCASEAA